jgi:hypothetical protein
VGCSKLADAAQGLARIEGASGARLRGARHPQIAERSGRAACFWAACYRSSDPAHASRQGYAGRVRPLRAWPAGQISLQEARPTGALTHAADRARALYIQAKQWLPAGSLSSVDVTPVIGAHIGPGAVGLAVVTS